MYAPGLEQLLARGWQSWVVRGGRPEAEPLLFREGCVLRLCRRARVSAWLIFLLFSGLLIGTAVNQVVAPQPPRQFWFLLVCSVLFALLATYYLIFAFWYRVELTDEAFSLRRFLLPTRSIAWREIVAFRLEPDRETLTFHSASGTKVAIYASLNGLSAVRRCLAAFTPLSQTSDSWAMADPVLMEYLPAWRCDERDLEDDPFAPLGSWQQVVYESSGFRPSELSSPNVDFE